MNKNKCFSVIGGDARSIEAANALFNSGYAVKVFAFNDKCSFKQGVIRSKTIQDATSDADYLLLPIPYSTNGESVNAPLYDNSLLLSTLFQHIKGFQTVFAGRIDESFHSDMNTKNISHYDYAKREEFAIYNAIPTAEGAIEIAFRECPFTVNGSRCLILGHGRIAKILRHMLTGLGAGVAVSARKISDLAWASSFGADAFSIYDLSKHIANYQIIFNTIPYCILTKDILAKAKQKPLIIDLASRPGGVDFEAAGQMNLKAIHALSLPGKVAPDTAGRIICDTVLNIISETEVKE